MAVRDRVVIVTGGAQGVGRYVARTFAAEGARVAVADVASMESVSSEIEKLEADFLTIRTDVTDESQVRSMVDQVYRRWGRIDVLVNDAGIVTHFHVGAPRWPRIRDMPRDFFQKVIDTNLIGTYLCTKHVLPYMESLNEGHVINFGQGNLAPRRAGGPANIGSCVYNVSKISIRAFTRSVAEEEREFNICIMSMGPGSGGGEGERREWKAGAGGGIVTEDSPAWAREREWGTVEDVGNRYVIAAEAPMEFSGHQVVVRDGKVEIATD